MNIVNNPLKTKIFIQYNYLIESNVAETVELNIFSLSAALSYILSILVSSLSNGSVRMDSNMKALTLLVECLN